MLTEKIEVTIRCKTCGEYIKIQVYEADLTKYQQRLALAQDAFPYLSSAERELFISGICGHCFDIMFPPGD